MSHDKKLVAAQSEYANASVYIDIFHSPACWKTATLARKMCLSLGSKTAMLAAVKEAHRIKIVGFG